MFIFELIAEFKPEENEDKRGNKELKEQHYVFVISIKLLPIKKGRLIYLSRPFLYLLTDIILLLKQQ